MYPECGEPGRGRTDPTGAWRQSEGPVPCAFPALSFRLVPGQLCPNTTLRAQSCVFPASMFVSLKWAVLRVVASVWCPAPSSGGPRWAAVRTGGLCVLEVRSLGAL